MGSINQLQVGLWKIDPCTSPPSILDRWPSICWGLVQSRNIHKKKNKQQHLHKQYFNSYNTRSIKSYKLLCYHLILKLRYSSLELFNYKFFKSLAPIAIDPIDIFSMYRIIRRIKHYSLNTVSIHSFSHKPVLLIRSLNRFNHHLVSSTPLSTSSFNLSYSLRFTSLLSLQTCISSWIHLFTNRCHFA